MEFAWFLCHRQGKGDHLNGFGVQILGEVEGLRGDQEHLPLLQDQLPVREPIQALALGGVVDLIIKVAVHLDALGQGSGGGLALLGEFNEI